MTELQMREPVRNFLLLGLVLGMLTGLAEALGLVVKQYVFGLLVLANPQVVWMGPAVYVMLVFLPLALVWAAAARLAPRWLTLPRATGIFTLLGGFFALEVFRVQLDWRAIWLLAAGIAVQVWLAASRHPEGFRRLLRRGSVVLAGLVALLAVALNGTRAWQERRAMAALPPAAVGAPNVLLLILDTVRALDMSLYGFALRTTPAIDRRGAEGVVFERAVATTSWTNPSHASLFTGRFPHELSSGWSSGLDGTHRTLAEVLRDAGYRTGGFVANNRYVSRAGGLGRGFVHYRDHLVSLGAAVMTTSLGDVLVKHGAVVRRLLGIDHHLDRVSAAHVNARLLSWLDGVPSRPYFAMLNYMEAHAPWHPPAPYASRFPVLGARTPASVERAAYDASLAWLDDGIGALLDSLQRRGRLTNTLVIVTSDHGEEFNEHGRMSHGESLYWPVIHVPLVVWFPGRVPAGVRVAQPVSLRDVAATILALTGAHAGPGATLPGRSLAPYWQGATAARGDTILSELSLGSPLRATVDRPDMKSLVIGMRHYIRNSDGSEELYDIAADPFETSNLAPSADSATLAPFRAVLARIPASLRRP